MNALAASAEADVLDVEVLELRALAAEGYCERIRSLADKALLEMGRGEFVDGDVARGLLTAIRGIARQGSGR